MVVVDLSGDDSDDGGAAVGGTWSCSLVGTLQAGCDDVRALPLTEQFLLSLSLHM